MMGQEFLEQLDSFYRKDALEEAKDFLQKTYAEAVEAEDISLQLTVLNEMMSYAGTMGEEELGMAAVTECGRLIEAYGLQDNAAIGTIWGNMATVLSRFDKIQEALAYYQMAKEKLDKNSPCAKDKCKNGEKIEK